MLAALGEIIRTMVLESLCRGGYFGVVQPIDDETAIQAAVAHVRYTYPGAGCINKHRTGRRDSQVKSGSGTAMGDEIKRCHDHLVARLGWSRGFGPTDAGCDPIPQR